jgi:hypothetical protein
MSLTIAYISARRNNRIEWFFDSLAKQVKKLQEHVIVVDHFENEFGRSEEIFHKFAKSFTVPLHIEHEEKGNVPSKFFTHVEPKPNVWSGDHRLTKENWFSVASSRNSAICLCRTSHIAFVDDLSVLCPGWWQAAQEAVAGSYIGLGAYRKVNNLLVENGEIIEFTATDAGIDDRLKRVDKDVSECDGGWLYGCSFVAPLEDLLEVGGFPEFCDSLGGEDYCLGIALRNAGKHLKFDRRMMTLESEELHFVEPAMKRTDKGVSPNDKSHAALRIAQGSVYYPNYYEGGIRALRDHVLAGNPFPIVQIPTHDWFDGQPISEM